MNRLKTYIVILLCIIIMSCRLVDVYDYIHPPTQDLRDNIIFSSHQNVGNYNTTSLMFVPDFRTFTTSFSYKYSKIYAISPNQNETFYFHQAILRVPDTEINTILEINESFSLEKEIGNTGLYFQIAFLFSGLNTDYELYKGKPNLILEIFYSLENETVVKNQVFEIELKKSKNIAWPT